MNSKRIAIACQGGGSHTAFTAGALKALIEAKTAGARFDIMGISGTSGGAVCATLAWAGLLKDGGAHAVLSLERFWRDGFPQGITATLGLDQLLNTSLVSLSRLPLESAVSPYTYDTVLSLLLHNPFAEHYVRPWLDAQAALKSLLEDYVPFADLPSLLASHAAPPDLLIGAIEVNKGTFQCFRGTHPDFGVDAVIASATLPHLMRAVHIEGGAYEGLYWDGLFSQNPPVNDFFKTLNAEHQVVERFKADKPDEIWFIRINPLERAAEPKTLHDIEDRRNELSGNLSIEHERARIEDMNALVSAFDATCQMFGEGQHAGALDRLHHSPIARHLKDRFKPVVLRPDIAMDLDVAGPLDLASKLNRLPEFIDRLFQHGEEKGLAFLENLRADGAI